MRRNIGVEMKKLILMVSALAIGQTTMALELGCINGPAVLNLRIGKVIDDSGFNTIHEGEGSVNYYFLNQEPSHFKGKFFVREVSTRAYYGTEIEGEIPELNGKLSLIHHSWFTHIGLNIPEVYQGKFENYKSNQSFNLVCFDQK